MTILDPSSTATLELVLAEVERQGDDAVAVRAGVDAVGPHAARSIWTQAQQLTADPFLGLNVATYGELDRLGLDVILAGPDLGSLLRALAIADPVLEYRPADATLTRPPGPHERAVPAMGEWLVTTWLRVAREATGRRLEARAVQFVHPAPTSTTHLAELRDAFGVAPTFEAPAHVLALDPACLELPRRIERFRRS